MAYRFQTIRFINDCIVWIEANGWDVFRERAKTTDKVMCRILGWSQGTISAHTVAKVCNVIGKSPLLYYKDNAEIDDSGFYE